MVSIAAGIEQRLMAIIPASAVLAWSLAPWLLVDVVVGSVSAAVTLGLFSLLMAGLGSLVMSLMRGTLGDAERVLLAPAVGLMVGGAVVSLCVRVGVSPGSLFWAITALGAVGLWKATTAAGKSRGDGVVGGVALMVVATVVCVVYFTPGAARDAVSTEGGGYQWMYVDTQYMMAVAASIKASAGVPVNPGLSTEALNYHYAPFALAGALSAATGLDLGDALVRVVRGATQHALLSAAAALGIVLGRYVGASRLAAVSAVTGLFFYGSLAALFAPWDNSTSNVSGGLLFTLPWLEVTHSGGPFAHIVLGHSVMNGMTGLTAVLAILLSRAKNTREASYPVDALCLLPGLLATWHSVAGLGATGIVAGVTVFYGYRKKGSWLGAALTLLTLAAVFIGMGYLDYPSASTMVLDTQMSRTLFSVFVWFYVGLGIRVIALRWISDLPRNPAGMVMLLAFLGYGGLTLLMFDPFDGHDRYGFKFLQPVVSIFAFVMLAAYLERRERLWQVVADTARIVMWSAVAFLGVAVVFMAYEGAAGQSSEAAEWSLRMTIASAAIAVFGAAAIVYLPRRVPWFGQLATVVLAGTYLLGFLAWVTPWANYGLGRGGMEIVLSADEVLGLRRLRAVSGEHELVATNRHGYGSFRQRKERSYAYRALLERPILIEGWHNGERYLPTFERVRTDNAAIFESSVPGEVRRRLREYGVKYVVAQPGTDLRIGEVPWLTRVEDTGSLVVYRVHDDGVEPTPVPTYSVKEVSGLQDSGTSLHN